MQIADRVSLWGGKNSPLPPGARWVEYLEGTGTQWIDTGFKATNGCKMEFRCLQTVANAGGIFVGSHNPSSNSSNSYNRNQAGIAGSGALKFNKCDRFEDFTVPSFDLQAFHTYSFDTRGTRRIGYFDGALVVNGTTTTTLKPVNNIVVWRLQYYPETSPNRCVAGKISFLKIWDVNDVLVRDFRPIAIGTTGYMLDLVSGEYLQYGNAGTGDFIVGPDAPAMTGGGYKRLCVKRSHRRSSRPSARFWHAAHLPRTWKEVA